MPTELGLKAGFHEGGLVKLRSGGPPMTIAEEEIGNIKAPSSVDFFFLGRGLRCRWFDKEDRLCEAWFLMEEVEQI